MSRTPPLGVQNYCLATIVSDAIAMLDTLEIRKAHLVGHDYGALAGWMLAGQHGERFYSYTALSVGHPSSYATGDWRQKSKTWFRGLFRLRGVSETLLKAGNWIALRTLVRNHPEVGRWVEDLSRPGRLTAAINWYRANIPVLSGATDMPNVSIPAMGVWSTEDIALAEDQMINSERYFDGSFRYQRFEDCGHWIPLDRPELTSSLLLSFFSSHNDQA